MWNLRFIFSLLLIFMIPWGFFAQKSENKKKKNSQNAILVEDPSDTVIGKLQIYEGFDFPQNYDYQYRYYLSRVKKVYPLALRAAEIIDSLDAELEGANRKSKQRKITRQTKKELKEDFKFIIRDMYVSEGQVLTKLIYRETGMTVRDIITKYKNGLEASMYIGAAKIFEQDLDAVYRPDTDDFVIECVIQDLEDGKIEFEREFQTMNKVEFKVKQQKEQAESKARKKKLKELKKKKKELEKKKKKESSTTQMVKH